MEITKHGAFIEKEKCEYCGCEFLYNIFRDTNFSYNNDREHTIAYKYVKCPECGHEIKLEKN